MNKKNIFLLYLYGQGIALSLLFLSNPNHISAHTFQSSSYIIDWGNLNITSGKKNSASYNLTDTVGQNAPGAYNSIGYQIKSGFQYIYDPMWKFVFTIDKINIDFNNLVPGVGSTNTSIISIASPSLGGYQIFVQENHPLQISTTTKIVDTACDGSTCTFSSSGLWSNATTYGFGFNTIGVNSSMTATGVGTSNYFTNANYYRPFANRLAGQAAQVIMSEPRPVKKSYARVTYKINIPIFQTQGKYENGITYIAVPKY